MPLVAFANTQQRLRQRGYPHQCWLTGTPAGRAHWLFAFFYPDHADPDLFEELHLSSEWAGPGNGDVWRETRIDPGAVVRSHYKTWTARTQDNPFGGRELYGQLVAVYGADSPQARQNLAGNFELLEGLTYDSWSATEHVKSENQWPDQPDRVVAGVDFGFSAPAAIVVEGLDRAGRRYLVDEFYRAGCSERQLIEAAHELQRKYGIRYFFADPADPRWISAMRHARLRIYPAVKRRGRDAGDYSHGIGLCTWALTHKTEEGGQAFYVSPKCRHFRMEIENYVREEARLNKNPRELPRQKGDHAMDAWRYAEEGLARLWDRPDRRGTPPPTNIRTEAVV